MLQAVDLDVNLLDKKIDQMMPELGFKAEDNDRLVASYSGGWQMRMCLGKLLLQVRQREGSKSLLCAVISVHTCPFRRIRHICSPQSTGCICSASVTPPPSLLL